MFFGKKYILGVGLYPDKIKATIILKQRKAISIYKTQTIPMEKLKSGLAHLMSETICPLHQINVGIPARESISRCVTLNGKLSCQKTYFHCHQQAKHYLGIAANECCVDIKTIAQNEDSKIVRLTAAKKQRIETIDTVFREQHLRLNRISVIEQSLIDKLPHLFVLPNQMHPTAFFIVLEQQAIFAVMQQGQCFYFRTHSVFRRDPAVITSVFESAWQFFYSQNDVPKYPITELYYWLSSEYRHTNRLLQQHATQHHLQHHALALKKAYQSCQDYLFCLSLTL